MSSRFDLRVAFCAASLALLAGACGPSAVSGGAVGGTVDSPDASVGGGPINIDPAPRLLGTWRPATSADQATAGFETLTLVADGTWSETGRGDTDVPSGAYTRPSTITIDPSFGQPPAGMHGPYLEIDNAPDGDSEWVYGWSETTDAQNLTLTLYAARGGMGLRWATPVTINLVPN